MIDKIRELLILDDSEEFINLLKGLLEGDNINIQAYSDVEQALNKTKEQKYNLIITDYLMGNDDGINFSKKVRQFELNKSVKIILLTAKDLDDDELSKVSKLGLIYIKKPIHPRDLKSQVNDLFK